MGKYNNFSKEDLITLLEKQDKELARKKYGLVWDNEKDPEQIVLDCAKNLPILKNVNEKDIKTTDDDYNIMIEGDNYHALQVLNYTHKEKIDVIYIDPPYNTGNKDFIYNDSFVEKDDGYRHSKWLNFMEKRLDLAKGLLSENGVIFISIDDNEQANLKLLCDKIFGEGNFISSFIWEKHKAPKNDNKFVTTNHEYIFLYAKNKTETVIKKIPRSVENLNSFKNLDNDPRGVWSSGPLLAPTYSDKTIFAITKPNGEKIYPPKGKCWAFSEEKIKSLFEQNKIWCGKDGKNVPRIKRFLYELPDGIGATSMLLHDDLSGTQKASNRLKQMFDNKKVFNFPKPLEILNRLFQISSNKNSIFLDFFAGSGTTGHAVMDLNKEDGGSRKFILCTNNENNIAEEVCYPRIKKAITGYKKNGDGEFIEGLGGNLKYFKTDFVTNSKNATQTKINIAHECSEMLCLKTGIFNKIEINNDFYKIFENNSKDTFLCVYFDFMSDNINCFISEIKKLKGKKKVFVFSLDDRIDKELFKSVGNVQIEPIPHKILEVYKKIAKDHIKGNSDD